MPSKPMIPKRGPGRPTLGETTMRRVLVTLDAETIAKARKLGGDNLSAGIRKAVGRART